MRRLRILLVEDNSGDVYLLHYSLRHAAILYDLQVCATGDEAVRHFEALSAQGADSLDILILDLNLPGISGIEVLRAFRRHCKQTPVLVFTSSIASRDVDLALDTGANRYFQKPSQLNQWLYLGNLGKSCGGGSVGGPGDRIEWKGGATDSTG